jgi:hypothetical protein
VFFEGPLAEANGNDEVLGASSGAVFCMLGFITFLPSSLPSALADGKYQ